MNKTISYKESTAIAIQAMISAARKDEYADRKRKSGFPQNRKKRDGDDREAEQLARPDSVISNFITAQSHT